MVRSLQRRQFIRYFSAAGLSGTLLPGTLWALLQQEKELKVSAAMIVQAEKIAGLEFTDAERDLMAEGVNEALEDYEKLRTVSIPNAVPPALSFNPELPGTKFETAHRPLRVSRPETVERPGNLEDAAFWPVTQLSQLVRSRQVTCLELAEMYLGRLKRHDPTLHCVITLTEEKALAQAKRADDDLRSGFYRGPLHGIPWGAKDLLAVRG